jgi:hypothetical protein
MEYIMDQPEEAGLNGRARQRIGQAVLNRVWYVQPVVVLLVKASPAACVHILETAARPSTDRLHLRNLFIGGRRYYIQRTNGGFRMNSNSKIPWLQRKRTRLAAVVHGGLCEASDGISRLRLSARMTPLHFLDIFLLPGWMGLLVIAGPLSLPVKILAVAVLLALSWLWHWYTAVLQAAEMIYFVQVALDEITVDAIGALPASTESVIYNPDDFQQAWQKFYDQHRNERGPS